MEEVCCQAVMSIIGMHCKLYSCNRAIYVGTLMGHEPSPSIDPAHLTQPTPTAKSTTWPIPCTMLIRPLEPSGTAHVELQACTP